MPVPTPQDLFGFGSVPLSSYFKVPAGASKDTRFSPVARALFEQEEQRAREQEAEDRRLEAEALANQLLGQAPGMSTEQVNQAILSNPSFFGQGVEGLSKYQQFRTQVAPSQSDEVLGPAYLNKIKDPRHAARFQDRMLREGLSANDAWDAYRTDEYNDKYAVQLAEAGIPDTEFQTLQVNGMFDPVAVSRRISLANQERTARGSQSETDRRLARIDKLLDLQRKRVEEGDTGYEKDKKGNYKYPNLVALEQQYESMVAESLLTPEEKASAKKQAEEAKKASVAPATVVPETTAKAEDEDELPPLPEQRESIKKETERKVSIEQRIGSAWTQAKNTIEKNILKKYSPEDLDLLAEAIVANRAAPLEAGARTIDTGAGAIPERYSEFILRKLGFNPLDVAFSEPENERWGTQDVTNQELLKVWAESRKEDIEARKRSANLTNPSDPKLNTTASGAKWKRN